MTSFWRRRIAILLACFLGVFAASLLGRSGFGGVRTFSLRDVQNREIISLRRPPNSGPVHRLTLEIKGKIDNRARITQGVDSKIHQDKMIGPGRVHLNLSGDWYDPRCTLVYDPYTVTSGHLSIRYKFHTRKR